MVFFLIKNIHVLSMIFLTISEYIWRKLLLHDYTSVKAVASLCSVSCFHELTRMLMTHVWSSTSNLRGDFCETTGRCLGGLHCWTPHIMQGQMGREQPCFPQLLHFPPPSVSMLLSHQLYLCSKLWDGLWLGTPLTSQSLIRTSVRGFCGTDMTLVPRIGPIKSPMRICVSAKIYRWLHL